MSQPAARRTPERTCVVCRSRQGKRSLVRIARSPDGRVVVDPTGKGPGRGAYLCPRRGCWRDPLLARRLGHALRTALTSDDLARLDAYAAGLAAESSDG